MSREIKLRAWDSKKEMFAYFKNGNYKDSRCGNNIKPIFNWANAEQYTGIKDFSSFKEVYQGDKVNIITNGREIKDLIVEWSDEKCGFVFVNECWNILFFGIEHIEIIGNIHEKAEK